MGGPHALRWRRATFSGDEPRGVTCDIRAFGFALFALAIAMALPARAEWRRNADVAFNTAYTLQEGTLTMGVLGPLDIGVTDTLQFGLHPILLLVGKPSVALRYRLTPVGSMTFALNAGATWSFIQRVDADGREADAGSRGTTGFPGTTQLTMLGTVELSPELTLTVGAGLGADFLGDTFLRAYIPAQVGLHLRLGAGHLLMVQGLVQFTPVDGGLRRPAGQLMYGLSLTPLTQLALGVTIGPMPWQTTTGPTTIGVFPFADIWFRF
jgi:hypothetical protein